MGHPLQFINNSLGHNTPESHPIWLVNGLPVSSEWDLHTVFNTWGNYAIRLIMISGSLIDSSDVFQLYVIDETPLAPQNVVLQSVENSYLLSWDAVTLSVSQTPITITHYNIYASEDPLGTFVLFQTMPASNRQLILNLSELGSKRFFKVTAEN